MNKLQTFEQFLTTSSAQIPIVDLVVNLFLAGVLALILSQVYVKCAKVLSNRKAFARNFILLTMTTMLIITIVKSSLALSLGLVGALSIVRFRTAIKEPEELSYMFLCIAVGLGLGADQRMVTIAAFIVICVIIALRSRHHKSEDNQNLYLTVTSHNPEKLALEQIGGTLKKYCSAVNMKRFDETKEVLEASFLVEFDSFEQLEAAKAELRRLNKHINIAFLDNKGLF